MATQHKTTNMARINSADNSDHELEKYLSVRSKTIIKAMEYWWWGVISYEEAAKYGKTQEKDIN